MSAEKDGYVRCQNEPPTVQVAGFSAGALARFLPLTVGSSSIAAQRVTLTVKVESASSSLDVPDIGLQFEIKQSLCRVTQIRFVNLPQSLTVGTAFPTVRCAVTISGDEESFRASLVNSLSVSARAGGMQSHAMTLR